MMTTKTGFVVVAGATGALGKLITKAVLARGVVVKALVRPNTSASRTEDIAKAGATIVPMDLSNIPTLTRELAGAMAVVSSLQGLEDVMHGAQGDLLDASKAAGVLRFIPSDFSLDFTKTNPGSNRNLDLRREFHKKLEESGISWTSILNGAFMDLLAGHGPMIDHTTRRVPYIGQPTQPLDFTTMADTAAYTAAVAVDPNPAPHFLRIASTVTSAQDMADAQTKVTGHQYTVKWMGPPAVVKATIRAMRLLGGEDELMPTWQAMQYMENMMSGDGKNDPLDNGRYPDLKWKSLEEFFRENNPQI